MAKTRWVAYSNLGNGSGAEVNPDDFGGLDSENWRYMVERRTVVPMGDPDAPAPPDQPEDERPEPELTELEEAQLRSLLAKKERAGKTQGELREEDASSAPVAQSDESARPTQADETQRQPGQAPKEVGPNAPTPTPPPSPSPPSGPAKPTAASGTPSSTGSAPSTGNK
jgi:hypothetical protein